MKSQFQANVGRREINTGDAVIICICFYFNFVKTQQVSIVGITSQADILCVTLYHNEMFQTMRTTKKLNAATAQWADSAFHEKKKKKNIKVLRP